MTSIENIVNYTNKFLENKNDYDLVDNEHDKKIGFLSYDLREHSVYFLKRFH